MFTVSDLLLPLFFHHRLIRRSSCRLQTHSGIVHTKLNSKTTFAFSSRVLLMHRDPTIKCTTEENNSQLETVRLNCCGTTVRRLQEHLRRKRRSAEIYDISVEKSWHLFVEFSDSEPFQRSCRAALWSKSRGFYFLFLVCYKPKSRSYRVTDELISSFPVNLFNLEVYSAHLQLWPASFRVFGRLIICLHVTVKCGEWKETWWRGWRSPTDVRRGVNLNLASRFDYDSAVKDSRCILRSRLFHTSNAGCCSSETFLPPSQSQQWLSSLCSPLNIRTHVSFPQFWSHQIVWVWLPEVWSHQIILIQWVSMTDSWCSKCCEIRLAKLVSEYNDKTVTCWGLWAAQDEARCQQIYWKLLLFLSDRNLLTFRLKLHRFVF